MFLSPYLCVVYSLSRKKTKSLSPVKAILEEIQIDEWNSRSRDQTRFSLVRSLQAAKSGVVPKLSECGCFARAGVPSFCEPGVTGRCTQGW
jgi:hypothetical protein